MFPYDYRQSKYQTYREALREHSWAERYYRRRIFNEDFGKSAASTAFAIAIIIFTLGLALVLHLWRRTWWWWAENHRQGVLNPYKPPAIKWPPIITMFSPNTIFHAFIVAGYVVIDAFWVIMPGLLYAIIFMATSYFTLSFTTEMFSQLFDTNSLIWQREYAGIAILFAVGFFLVEIVLNALGRLIAFFRWRVLHFLALGGMAAFTYVIITAFYDQSQNFRYANTGDFITSFFVLNALALVSLILILIARGPIIPEAIPDRSRMTTPRPKPHVYRVYLDHDAERSADFNALFIEYIVAIFGECSFRVTGNCERIIWEIIDLRGQVQPQTAIHTIQVKLPHVKVVHLPPDHSQNLALVRDLIQKRAGETNQQSLRDAVTQLNLILDKPQDGLVFKSTKAESQKPIVTTQLHSIGHFLRYVAPLRSAADLTPDEYPLADVTQVISQVPAHEFLSVTLIVNGASRYAQDRGYRYITVPFGLTGTFFALFGRGNRVQNPRLSPREFGLMEEKLSQQLYHCLYFVSHSAIAADPKPDAFELLVTALQQVSLRSANRLVVFDNHRVGLQGHTREGVDSAFEYAFDGPLRYYHHWTTEPSSWKAWRHTEMILTSGEMANLWRLPDEHFMASSIEWLDETPPVSETLARNESGILLGIGRRDGEDVEVIIPDDTRHRHMAVLGQTGMGKSTFLHNLIHQDIRRGDGRAVVVLDPHGDLVADVLRWSVPEGREDDVIVLQLNNRSHPIPFNLFDMSRDHRTLEQLADVIDTMEARTAGFQTRRFLYLGLRAVAYLDQPTMLDFLALLENEDYGQTIIERCRENDDHVTADTWQGYWDKTTSAQMRSTIKQPLLNRISTFYLNEYLMHSLCHPLGLPFDQYLSEGKILLFSLDNSNISVSSAHQNLIGAMFVSLLKSVAMSRAQGQRNPVYCYVDEQQRFSTPAFAEIFSEARKYGLYMTVGNQYTSQLDESTVAAIRGNVATHVAFKLGLDDVTRFETVIGEPFKREELLNLDRFTMAIKTQLNGYNQPPFLARTLPPPNDVWNMPETEAKDRKRDEADERTAEITSRCVERENWMTRREVVGLINQRYFRGDADRPLRGGTMTFDE